MLNRNVFQHSSLFINCTRSSVYIFTCKRVDSFYTLYNHSILLFLVLYIQLTVGFEQLNYAVASGGSAQACVAVQSGSIAGREISVGYFTVPGTASKMHQQL